MNEELIKTACSDGEDKDFQKYFAGRHRELNEALNAFEAHGMVAIGGYALSGKTYLALKLFDRLGVSVKNKPLSVTKELIYSDTPVLGVMCEVNSSQAVFSFRTIFGRLFQGSADYQGLLALVADPTLRRELNVKLSSMLMTNDSRETIPAADFQPLLGMLSEVISVIKSQALPKEIIVCFDGIERVQDTSEFNDLVECLLDANVGLIFTFSTSLKYFPIQQLAERYPQLESIYVNRLTDEEIDELIDLIETNVNGIIHFDPQARGLLKSASGNIPYFVHFLCEPAIHLALLNNETAITQSIIEVVIEFVFSGGLISLYDGIYDTLTKSQLQVDYLLKYARMRDMDDCYNESVQLASSEIPVGGLMLFKDSSFVIANPAIQVYARMRLGV